VIHHISNIRENKKGGPNKKVEPIKFV